MSQENVEVVRRALDAYCRGDIDTVLELVDPAVEVRSLLLEHEGGTFHGRDGVRNWLAAVHEVFPDWFPQLERADDLGDGAVVASIHVTATAAASGAPIEEAFWYAARLANGRLVFFGFFRTEEDARLSLSGP